jgi:inorganic pyrophosphatase
MTASLVCGTVIALIYRQAYEGVLFQKAYAMTIVMICLVTTMVIMVISGNLVLSLGGDALDVLLISESVEAGTILNIIPIGVLVLEDFGEIDTKIIAIPLEKSAQIIDASSYDELHKNYSALKDIIKLWFVHYKGEDVIKFVKWDNEIAAQKEINKWISN